MKIAVINIADRIGGSALAAFRTAETMIEMGHDVRYIVRTKSLDRADVIATRKNAFQNTVERYFNAAINLLGLQYMWLPFSPRHIRQAIKEFQPDVIWLNNPIGGYFQLQDLTWLSQQAPLLWTMHDQWSFMANAGFDLGTTGWKEMKPGKGESKIYPTIGLPTGSFLLKRKKKIYEQAKPVFIAPSMWLYELAQTSPVMDGQKILYVTHGLDLSRFTPGNADEARKALNIPTGVPLIMFIAQTIKGNFFKGGQDLKDILDELEATTAFPIHVLLLGSDMPEYMREYKKLIMHPQGYVKDETKLINAYRAADVLLYPTRADNMPLVLIEASACGLPTVTFNTGGGPEIIEHNVGGYILEQGENKAAAAKVLTLLTDNSLNKSMGEATRKAAERKYDIKEQALRYLKVFEEHIALWKTNRKA